LITVQLLGGDAEAAIADVIFLHGLQGDWQTTWLSGEREMPWPGWLGEDSSSLAVWSVNYPASATKNS
jgi:hypothetical protein